MRTIRRAAMLAWCTLVAGSWALGADDPRRWGAAPQPVPSIYERGDHGLTYGGADLLSDPMPDTPRPSLTALYAPNLPDRPTTGATFGQVEDYFGGMADWYAARRLQEPDPLLRFRDSLSIGGWAARSALHGLRQEFDRKMEFYQERVNYHTMEGNTPKAQAWAVAGSIGYACGEFLLGGAMDGLGRASDPSLTAGQRTWGAVQGTAFAWTPLAKAGLNKLASGLEHVPDLVEHFPTGALDAVGNWIGRDSNWFGRNVTGGQHGATERDQWGQLPLGDTLVPGKTWSDQIARMHDIEYYLSAHPDLFPKGQEVAIAGPRGTEYYTPGSVLGANVRLAWRHLYHAPGRLQFWFVPWSDIEGRHTPRQDHYSAEGAGQPWTGEESDARRRLYFPGGGDDGGGGAGPSPMPLSNVGGMSLGGVYIDAAAMTRDEGVSPEALDRRKKAVLEARPDARSKHWVIDLPGGGAEDE